MFEPTFQVETLAQVREEIPPLFERHYAEVASFKDIQKLDPDWEAYERIEAAGKLWIMTVRCKGLLIGYFFMMLANDLHYRKLRRATEDLHYLIPEYRKGLLGYRLIRKVVEAMKAKGADMITLRTKAGLSHAVLFERLGGELEDLVYKIPLNRNGM